MFLRLRWAIRNQKDPRRPTETLNFKKQKLTQKRGVFWGREVAAQKPLSERGKREREREREREGIFTSTHKFFAHQIARARVSKRQRERERERERELKFD